VLKVWPLSDLRAVFRELLRASISQISLALELFYRERRDFRRGAKARSGKDGEQVLVFGVVGPVPISLAKKTEHVLCVGACGWAQAKCAGRTEGRDLQVFTQGSFVELGCWQLSVRGLLWTEQFLGDSTTFFSRELGQIIGVEVQSAVRDDLANGKQEMPVQPTLFPQ
jgi:hypothetical protein